MVLDLLGRLGMYIEDSPMMLPLLLSLVVSVTDDPPVKVWLNHDNYFQRGDKARVNVRLADDGYLLVLRADAEGRVRVLFPLDPSNDDFTRGHETIEVRGRGDREAFFVDDREGSGLVLAARSSTPFKFDEFVRGDHWDYRVLDARQAGDDKEAALVDMVQRMTPDGHFDYDAVTRSEEHTSELQSRSDLVCRLLLEKKKKKTSPHPLTHDADRRPRA